MQLIQVTSSIKNEKTKKRELSSFSKTIDELKLTDIKTTVICEDNSSIIEHNNIAIEILNIKYIAYMSISFSVLQSCYTSSYKL